MTFLQVLPTEGQTQVNVKGNFLAVRDETCWSKSQNCGGRGLEDFLAGDSDHCPVGGSGQTVQKSAGVRGAGSEVELGVVSGRDEFG